MTAGRPGVLLVVGSGNRRYREYLLAGAARKRRLWMLDSVPATWQRPYLAGFTQVDVTDPEALVAATKRLSHLVEAEGVFCYDEALILPASYVTAALDLPGMRPPTVWKCRDKHRSRAALTAAGIPQPLSVAVSGLEQARSEADRIGYPVVLKPRGLGASQGVVLAGNPGRLDAAYRAASSARYPGVPTFAHSVLVEEYLDGPEISVDGFVQDGMYSPLFLARKELGPPPYFEETGHIVDPADSLLRSEELLALLEAAHRALGVSRGMTHTEIRLTPAGPRIVEVNGRVGGDLIPYLGLLATGIDAGAVAAQVAAGELVDAAPTRSTVIGVRFVYPPQDCTVQAMALPAVGSMSGLLAAEPMAEVGAVLRLPPRGYVARFAFLIAEGSDRAACRRTLDAAAAEVRLDRAPAPPFDPSRSHASWLPAAARAVAERAAS